MFKNITSNDKSLRPFKTYKQFTFNETDSGSGIFGLEGISGSAHNFITGSALSQSYGAYQTGSYSLGTFYKLPTYFSTKHLYYQYDNIPNPRSKNTRYPIYTAGNWTRKWPHGRPELNWGTINPRQLHNKANVISIPREFYGEEIKPGSIILEDSSGDTTVELRDDRFGQLYDWKYSASFAAGTPSSTWYNLNFNGTGSYIDLGAATELDLGQSAFTVTTWVNYTNILNDAEAIVGIEAFTYDYGIAIGDDVGKIGGYRYNGSATKWWYNASGSDENLLNDGGWHHIVYTFDGVDKTVSTGDLMYVDGVNVLFKDGALTPGAEASNSIGLGGHGAENYYNGKMTQTAIYNKKLTAAEVLTQYNLGIAGDYSTDTGLVGYWKMNNITSLEDLSVNSNSGTLYGNLTASSALTLYETTGSVVGNVFYEHGIITITDTGSLYQSCSIGKVYPYTGQYGGSDGFTLQFQATHTSYEYEYMCNTNKYEFNYTTNPSTIFGRSGSIKIPNNSEYIINGDLLNPEYDSVMDLILPASTSSYKSSYNSGVKYESFITHSEFGTYITNIGLYNDDNELLVIGKLSNPVKNDKDLALTFAIRFDS